MTLFAAVQLTSTADYQENTTRAVKFIKKAADNGAKVVSLPETFTFIGGAGSDKSKYKQDLKSDLVVSLGQLAREKGIYLNAGSIHEAGGNSAKMFNTSLLFSPEGETIAVYRKIHLFDADIPGPEKYKESDNFASGSPGQLKAIETSYGSFGLSICYDLRFPELYRRLTLEGAQVIFVPSAFTMHTGKDHWEVLLRARAIENQVYIVAPGQFGFHNEKRESYGNSMIIDPWGKVISRASDREEVIYADIDLEYLAKIRRKMPCLSHMKITN